MALDSDFERKMQQHEERMSEMGMEEAKRKVLERWPDAFANQATGWPANVWRKRDNASNEGMLDLEDGPLGTGCSIVAAWIDAAERLGKGEQDARKDYAPCDVAWDAELATASQPTPQPVSAPELSGADLYLAVVRKKWPSAYTEHGVQYWQSDAHRKAYMKSRATEPEGFEGYLGYTVRDAAEKVLTAAGYAFEQCSDDTEWQYLVADRRVYTGKHTRNLALDAACQDWLGRINLAQIVDAHESDKTPQPVEGETPDGLYWEPDIHASRSQHVYVLEQMSGPNGRWYPWRTFLDKQDFESAREEFADRFKAKTMRFMRYVPVKEVR